MDGSFGLMASPTALHASRSAVAHESATALANNAKESGEMQDSAMPLSARERAIVLLMGHGLSNKQIAHQLSIAPETVKSHAKRIFWKLSAQSRAQAVYRAWTLGLV